MEKAEFERRFEAARAANPSPHPGVEPIDLVPATEDEIAAFETGIGVRLAEQHREFLREHGGGRLLFLDVCPSERWGAKSRGPV